MIILVNLSKDEESKWSKISALAQTPDDKFDVKCGVRQGGPKSPLLYNLLMDYVMRVYLEECDKGNINLLKLKYNTPDVASHSEIASVGFHTLDWIDYVRE